PHTLDAAIKRNPLFLGGGARGHSTSCVAGTASRGLIIPLSGSERQVTTPGAVPVAWEGRLPCNGSTMAWGFLAVAMRPYSGKDQTCVHNRRDKTAPEDLPALVWSSRPRGDKSRVSIQIAPSEFPGAVPQAEQFPREVGSPSRCRRRRCPPPLRAWSHRGR